mgnify:CR=1 FL=1
MVLDLLEEAVGCQPGVGEELVVADRGTLCLDEVGNLPPGTQVAAASINGLIVAITLLYIIFGAILLGKTLYNVRAIDLRIKYDPTMLEITGATVAPGTRSENQQPPLSRL